MRTGRNQDIVSRVEEAYQEFLSRIGEDEFTEPYRKVCRSIRRELEQINEKYSRKLGRTFISQIIYRIKTPESCLNKLLKKNQAPDWENAPQLLGDIAGVRVVCSFLDDMYKLAEIISESKTLEVVKVKDYVRNPKESGYQSLHIIVLAPVETVCGPAGAGREACVRKKAEIQIRTQAMNFWASVEHHFVYKNETDRFLEDYDNRFRKDLKECARTIYRIDRKMLRIRKKMEKAQRAGRRNGRKSADKTARKK